MGQMLDLPNGVRYATKHYMVQEYDLRGLRRYLVRTLPSGFGMHGFDALEEAIAKVDKLERDVWGGQAR